MKASIFIKTALVDQMQVIADAGLWFHLAKLIPSGVEVLARAWVAGNWPNYDGHIFLPDTVSTVTKRFYAEFLPEYVGKYPETASFYSSPNVTRALCDGDEYRDRHLQEVDGVTIIHVPLWFADFKTVCAIILAKIESGELGDIDVFQSVKL